MEIIEANNWILFLDIILKPLMWILNGFKFPLQETHLWHIQNIDFKISSVKRGVLINNVDTKAKFGHEAPFGLYHMPVFGGLTKYVVIEINKFSDHWHVGWRGKKSIQIHKLKIKTNRIKLLASKGTYTAFGVSDSGKFIQLKVVGSGKIGDKRFEGLRLF